MNVGLCGGLFELLLTFVMGARDTASFEAGGGGMSIARDAAPHSAREKGFFYTAVPFWQRRVSACASRGEGKGQGGMLQ